MKPTRLVAAIIATIITACTNTPQSPAVAPTPASPIPAIPTPDIAATAIAAVFATLTAQPTVTPTVTPTATPSATPSPSATSTPSAMPTPTTAASATPSATALPSPSPTPSPAPTSTPSATPSSTATASPTFTPAPIAAGDIYRRLAPSVAYIEVGSGSGSGVLVEGGYIVSNAHVLWPHDSARVVFPGGETFEEVPLLNVDHLTDLAVLGPIETKLEPIAFASGEDLQVGDEVYLIGYPGESESFPQAALARGIISRMRQWDSQAITYFQSDAAVGGGQSGGILADAEGNVIGISGFSFADGNFVLAASASDLLDRVQRLAAGEDVDGIEPRNWIERGRRSRHEFEFEHFYDQRMFVVNDPLDTSVTVTVKSDDEAYLTVENTYGEQIGYDVDEGRSRDLEAEFTVDLDAPFFVAIGPASMPSGEQVNVSSSTRLRPFEDPDDGRRIEIGESIAGQLDFGGDMDAFRLLLDDGQRIVVSVDSIEIDPHLTLDSAGERMDALEVDDDSGGGPFGTNALLEYVANGSEEYLVVIEGASGYDAGGYVLTVEGIEK